MEDSSEIDRPATAPAVSSTSSGQDSGRWRDMLTIALAQATKGKWYVSTLQLQLASFEDCVACRDVRTLRVTVNTRTPLTLWDDDGRIGAPIEPPARRPLPTLRAFGAAWKIPARMLVPLLSRAALLREVEWMQLTDVDLSAIGYKTFAPRGSGGISQSVTRPVHSPRSYFGAVKYLLTMWKCCSSEEMRIWYDVDAHGVDTDKDISSASWPSALRHLSIGCLSDMVDLEALPKSLERLVVGGCFDQPVESVHWPVTLEYLALRGYFNHPIAEVAWPARLAQLDFGIYFNKPIADVTWPASLLRLTFEGRFNQNITGVVWPASLQRLAFGCAFNQPITEVVWPVSLQKLSFGHAFDQPIIGVVWPASLQQLSFAHSFNQPIAGVLWPASLQQLSFRGIFDQPITEVVWPAALTQLKFGDSFDHPINMVVWPSCLQSLVFGIRFDQPLEGMTWPASLLSITLSEEFIKKADPVVLPPFTHPLCRYETYEQGDGFDYPNRVDIFDNPSITFLHKT